MFKKKATDEQLIKSYEITKNVWETAEEFGMCGQSVHERLTKLGVINKINVFTEKDYKVLKKFYETNDLKKGSNELEKFAKKMGRTKQFLSRKAKELGLTSYSRGLTNEYKKIMSAKAKEQIKKNGHPQGMLGKHHTEEVCKKLSKTSKKWYNNLTEEQKYERLKRMLTNRKKPIKRNNVSWKQGYREVADKRIFFRSSWEYNYSLYLQYLKDNKEIKEWYFESDIFWFEGIKRGCVSYKPDFKVIRNDNTFYFIEIKGWMDSASKTKIKRMAKYHPEIELVVIDTPKYKEFAKEWRFKLDKWE